MLRFLGRRAPSFLIVLLGSSLVAFALPRLAPGDPALTLAGPDPSAETVAAIRAELGLDKNIFLQYFEWLIGIFQGDLGTSYVYKRPVAGLIASRLESTLELMLAAVVVMILAGIILGGLGGGIKNPVGKSVVDIVNTVLLAIPDFLFGLIMILTLGVAANLLPVSGEMSILENPVEGLRYLVMPAIALAIGKSAIIGRLIESSMKANQREQFIELATAKGVPGWRITTHHVLRNSLGAGVAGIGMRVAYMFAGAVVIESIFARAGVGSLVVDAVQANDYFVIQAVILLAVVVAALAQIITELTLAALDPRIRLGD